MPPVDTWLDKLKELLCRLYQEWGGDCGTLPSDIRSTIAVLRDCYTKYGSPRPPDPTGAGRFDALLAEIEAHLDLSENTLDPIDEQVLEALLSQLKP
jgi:hypothetical protein